MDQEQQLFLLLLRDHLHMQSSQLPEKLNLGQLAKLANAHELGGVCYCQCMPFLQEHPEYREDAAMLQTAFQVAVSHAAVLEYDLNAVSEAFQREKIPFIPIKGAVIAPYYPEPSLRTMGDVDLLVRREDRERIRAVMEALEFQNKCWSEQEWDYSRGIISFELQAVLLHDRASENRLLIETLNDFWPYAKPEPSGSGFRLDWSFHFLYLIAHIAKHMTKTGVGFRQFYDIAILLSRAGDRFDWNWISAEAERIGLLRFTRSCLSLCEAWFEVPSPLPGEPMSEELIDAVTERVFDNGVFGFQSSANRSQALSRMRKKSGLPLPILKLRVFLRLLFPSYRNLCTLSKYAGLRGKPWLLPWYWLKRLFRGLRSKRNGRLASRLLSITEQDLSEREQQLNELGL